MNRANKNKYTQVDDYKCEHHVTELNNYKHMKRNNILNFNRLSALIRQDFSTNLWKILLASEALWGVLVISLLYFSAFSKNFNLHNKFYTLILVFVGLFVASLSFGELNDKRKGHFFLTFSASSLEKFISRYLYSTVGYLVLIIFVFYTSSLCAYGINLLLFNQKQILFDVTNQSMITAIFVFSLLHPIFFFGALYFRRLAFLKMILTISGLILLTVIIVQIEMRIILWDHVDIFSLESFGLKREWIIGRNSMQTLFTELESLFNFFMIIVKSGIVSLFFLLLSYLKLKETEL